MANLYFRYGAMNCGKTTSLLQVAHNYEENGMKVALIKSSIDKKAEDRVSSRLGIERKVDLLLLKEDTIKGNLSLDHLDAIIVDEAQFLTKNQVEELWMIAKLKDIPVLCYGLRTSFIGESFEGSKTLLEKADKLEELATICKCGKKARFNARIINGSYTIVGDEVAIDGIDAQYESMCGTCFLTKVLKKDTY